MNTMPADNREDAEDTVLANEKSQPCTLHGERLARIEEQNRAILEEVKKTNGRTTALEEAVSKTSAQMSAHQMMWINAGQEQNRLEERLDELEISMGNMKDWKAEVRGGTKGILYVVQNIATIIALLVATWTAVSSHIQAQAANQQLRQELQQEQRREMVQPRR